MKRLLIAAFIVLSLVACASPSGSTYAVDQEKMAAVERAASRSGVAVHWINAPKKATVAPSGG